MQLTEVKALLKLIIWLKEPKEKNEKSRKTAKHIEGERKRRKYRYFFDLNINEGNVTHENIAKERKQTNKQTNVSL